MKFTLEQEKFIIEKINLGWSYTKIGKTLSLDRRKIANWCYSKGYFSQEKIKKNHKSKTENWDKNRKSKFIDMYNKVELGIYVYDYKDILKEFPELVSRDSIQSTAEKLGLSKRKEKVKYAKALTIDQRKFIVENNNKKNVYEIALDLKINERTIVNFLKSQNIEPNRANPRYKKNIMLKNKDFCKDYNDLTLTTSYICSKWSLNEKTIYSWRKQDFGNYSHKVNPVMKRTKPEAQFEDILFELKIPYFYQWEINKWTIDFYLGHKICVEIDGSFWHDNTVVKQKDERKIKDLIDKGYTIINFTEEEVYNDKESIKKKISEFAVLRQDHEKS